MRNGSLSARRISRRVTRSSSIERWREARERETARRRAVWIDHFGIPNCYRQGQPLRLARDTFAALQFVIVSSSHPRRRADKAEKPARTGKPTRVAGSNGRLAGTGQPEAVDNVTRVYHELRALIISGQLPPGARIAERAVVARTGLSRTPIRSALHRLQQEGLVASVGRAGDQRLIVTPLTREDGREVFLIVGHLEGLAASEAASLPAERRRELVRRLREVNQQLA